MAERIPHISEPLFDVGSQKINDNWHRFLDDLSMRLEAAAGQLPSGGGGALAQGKHTIWVPSTAMMSDDGLTPELVSFGTDGATPVLALDAGTAEFLRFAVAMPASWDEGDISFQVYWAHPATTDDFGTAWTLELSAFGNDDPITNTGHVAVTVTDTGGTTDDLYISPESSGITPANSPQTGDLVRFTFFRAVDNAADDMAVDAYLIGIKVLFSLNAGNDA